MPTFTASKSPNGFTLVELMVVIFIIGLASAAVVMMTASPDRGVRNDAEQLAARVAALRDHAILQSRGMAVWVRPSGYGFDARSDGVWRPLTEPPFTSTNWKRGTVAQIGKGGQLRVVFDSTGIPSSAMQIGLKRGTASASVDVSATGDVDVSR